MKKWMQAKMRLLLQMAERYFTDGVSHAAAELAFFLLFSLFPLLMVLNSLLGMANISDAALLEVTRFLPDDVQNVLLGYLAYLQERESAPPLLIGSIMTLYFLSRAVRSIIYSMSRVYCSKRGGMLHNLFISLILTAGLLLLIGASTFSVVAGQWFVAMVERWFPTMVTQAELMHYLAYPIAVAIALIFLMLLYSLVPPVRVHWRNALPGACVSLIGWFFLTRCFAYYVDHMGRYSILYGSIGAIIVLMLWLYLTSTTLIMGGVLNQILLEHRTGQKREHTIQE